MQNCTRPNRPNLDATTVPTELDIAWAAGIYEGEGCCRLAGKTKRGLMVQIVQKDHELLYWLRDWFGGSIQNQGTQANCGVWNCCGDRARIFLGLIYGRMTARRRAQIDATGALEYLRGRSPVGLNLLQLRAEMESFYAEHKEIVRLRRKAAAKRAYLRRYADPEYRAKYLAQQAGLRKMQKNSKPTGTPVKVIEMERTA